MSPVNTYEVALVVPTCTPPRYSRYPATPTLSVEACQDRPTDTGPTPEATNPPGTDGATVSGVWPGVVPPPLPPPGGLTAPPPESAHAAVLAVSTVVGDRLPLSSSAAMPSVYVVPHASPENVYSVDATAATCVPFRNKR